jgi:hypothetical protein
VLHGLAAGAVGTLFLNAATYLDMAVRGRPASPLPEADVEIAARKAGISLGDDEQTATARKQGIATLMGYAAGLAGGVALAAARPAVDDVPWPVAALGTGVAVMVAANAGSVAAGTTDPRAWSPADWMADVVPHVVYGVGAVLTLDALER